MTKWHVSILLLLLALSSGCAFSFGGSPSGSIVYQSDEFSSVQLFSINPANQSTTRLTNKLANNVSPTYIKVTKQIGFVSDQEGSWGIYYMDLAGNNIRSVLEEENLFVDYPAWSPDGRQIAASLTEDCTASSLTCNYDIYIMNADGSNLRNLTSDFESDWLPDWSPDGKKIAFSSDRDGDSEVYVINANGTGLQQLTVNNLHDGRPRWSPDGKTIAFETERDGDWEIYLMDADGSNPRPVTANDTSDYGQSWSPDGRWLVYLNNSDGDDEIYIIDRNGENMQRLTDNFINETAVIWIP